MKRTKVLAITGIRSEYDILYPVLKRLSDDPSFELKLAVSSAHLSEWHNYTVKKIEEDGFTIADKIDSLFMTNRIVQRSKGAGILTYALSQTVERETPDFILVAGDREESIAAAVVGNYMGILTAHLGGGDPVFGNADDPIRMAVSKLAHIHFVTAEPYGDNLMRMSEDPFRIIFSGNPALHNILHVPRKSMKEISTHISFKLEQKKYLVLVQHPLSSELDAAQGQMKATLQALDEFCSKTGYKVVASNPNTDPGSYRILKAMESYRNKDFICFIHNLNREYFVNLMRHSAALIGNSSMGILEAPSYGLPVVNVGNRQQGRLSAGNVHFVKAESKEIQKALEKACLDESYRKKVARLRNPYGDGSAPDIIAKTLKSIRPGDPKWLIKKKLC